MLAPVSRYRVCFDGKWQGSFTHRDDALDWAQAVGESGRIAYMARAGVLRLRLIAIFPKDQQEEGRNLWKARMTASGAGGWGG
jgi:hypothetical protein